jgi:2-hydroxychromene-2-carboxylate isomerase
MAPAPALEFWFTMGSTYTYLTVMRLPEVERSSGVAIRWRPFDLRSILQEMKHVPFADKPAKQAYMWRDIQRRAPMRGVPVPRVPAPYPLKNSPLANRVAMLGVREGWGQGFGRAAYRRWFGLGQESGSEPNVSESLREVGQDPQRVLALAQSDEVARAGEAETAAARGLGIFGSPTFVVGGEVFWGDDRLEDAISWLKHGEVRRA